MYNSWLEQKRRILKEYNVAPGSSLETPSVDCIKNILDMNKENQILEKNRNSF